MSIEKEYYNQILPLGNTPATRSMAAFAANATGASVNLNDVFGPTGGAGHFYEFKADNVPSGQAIYVAVAPTPTYGINPVNTLSGGTGTTFAHTGAAWPLFNGQSIVGRLPYVGRESSPTLPGYPTGGYRATFTAAPYLHFRTNAGGTGAVLRVRQSSLVPGADAGEPKGFPVPY